MHILKKSQVLLIMIILLSFSACIKKFDSDGLTLKIPQTELNNFSGEFPIIRNFVFANIELQKPYIFIKEGTNRLSASININFSTIFIPNSTGKFIISGYPYFDKEKSAIFLKDINIEELQFTNIKLDENLISALSSNTKPIVDNIFNTIPVYKIDKSSFKGSFVKDIKIVDSELLVTFGL